LTFDCTSEKATSLLFSSRKVIVTLEMPCEETDVMLSILEIVLTCFSISSVTAVSISSAEVPFNVVVTLITGKSTLGF